MNSMGRAGKFTYAGRTGRPASFEEDPAEANPSTSLTKELNPEEPLKKPEKSEKLQKPAGKQAFIKRIIKNYNINYKLKDLNSETVDKIFKPWWSNYFEQVKETDDIEDDNNPIHTIYYGLQQHFRGFWESRYDDIDFAYENSKEADGNVEIFVTQVLSIVKTEFTTWYKSLKNMFNDISKDTNLKVNNLKKLDRNKLRTQFKAEYKKLVQFNKKFWKQKIKKKLLKEDEKLDKIPRITREYSSNAAESSMVKSFSGDLNRNTDIDLFKDFENFFKKKDVQLAKDQQELHDFKRNNHKNTNNLESTTKRKKKTRARNMRKRRKMAEENKNQ